MAASFFNIDYVYIDINISDVEYNGWIHIFMEDRKKPPEALHAWLIMLKAWRSSPAIVSNTLKRGWENLTSSPYAGGTDAGMPLAQRLTSIRARSAWRWIVYTRKGLSAG
jgi:hypothetical protein